MPKNFPPSSFSSTRRLYEHQHSEASSTGCRTVRSRLHVLRRGRWEQSQADLRHCAVQDRHSAGLRRRLPCGFSSSEHGEVRQGGAAVYFAHRYDVDKKVVEKVREKYRKLKNRYRKDNVHDITSV